MKKLKGYKLNSGEKLNRSPNKPIISLLEDGKRSYLWIGNNAEDDKACFATLAGPATLRKLAHQILNAVNE